MHKSSGQWARGPPTLAPDAVGTYQSWFLWEERLKNFRSIRRGLQQVATEMKAGRHVDYVIEVILEVWNRRQRIGGLRLMSEAPFVRHFTAELEPVRRTAVISR